MIKLENLVTAIQSCVSTASDAISDNNSEHLLSYFEPREAGSTGPLRPKTVSMDFPTITAMGPEVHTVHVPLIAICPHVGTRISTLKFSAELEAGIDDTGSVQIAFPALKPMGSELPTDDSPTQGAEKRAPVTIEIVVESMPPPDGMKKIIEGYSRALRAQVPG